LVASIAAALAETTRERDDQGDGQRKKKTGTATMHEPSLLLPLSGFKISGF
jgi:hypothetical protein